MSIPEFRELFRNRMQELGWTEGGDYAVVSFPAPDGRLGLDQIEKEVGWLVRQDLDVLLVSNTAAAAITQRHTRTLPVVMIGSGYPVEAGVADSLARPGRNVTGNSIYAGTGIWGKLLSLLRESKPGIRRVGILWGYVPPMFPIAEVEPCYDEFRQASKALGLSIVIKEVAARTALPATLSSIASERLDALFLSGWLSAGEGWPAVVEFAIARKLPTIADFTVDAGDAKLRPLLVYSTNPTALWRQAIPYVDRILRGAKPGDLPIQLPARFDLSVDLNMAKAIGLTVPQSILLRADKVIG